jgi:hypothetical protein
VRNKKTGAAQGTVVVFFAPFKAGGGHYETATATMRATAVAGPQTTADFLGEAKLGKFQVISDNAALFDDKTLAKPLMQSSATPRGKAQPVVLARDTEVEVTALELLQAQPKEPIQTPRYVAKVKGPKGEGWTFLASLTPLP